LKSPDLILWRALGFCLAHSGPANPRLRAMAEAHGNGASAGVIANEAAIQAKAALRPDDVNRGSVGR
jgi:hypothetical protein